jgi:NhaA family Na+:H+ antiporter
MSSQSDSQERGVLELLQEFSIPLLSGVFVALMVANASPEAYARILHWEPIPGLELFHHHLDFHFLVNDIFMVFFFGIAAKEITESCLPGGALNPPSKAVTPLFATLGGVVGPVAVFFGGLWGAFALGLYDANLDDWDLLARGWGIPTATDIALAWLVARTVFGKGHPAVAFLLLLAVADDAIGLVIIAAFYGDPDQPAEPIFLLLTLGGMLVAYGMRRAGLKAWTPYIFVAGPLSWSGLILAHLHPALALAVVVPFLPAPRRDFGLFDPRDEYTQMGPELAADLRVEHSTLDRYEHQTKLFVDFGLFFFAFCNAGVELSTAGTMTWLVLLSLVVGKTVGIAGAGLLAQGVGLSLPAGMSVKDLVVAGFIAALGLTVALFVADAAFSEDAFLQGQAKMGALLSGLVCFAAVVAGRVLGVGESGKTAAEAAETAAARSPAGEAAQAD